MIRLMVPVIEDDDLQAVEEVLRSGFLVQGARVKAFEEQVAAQVGTRHAVAVANCTAALHLALLALGVGRGDKVAVTTYSWPATGNVIALVGAEPVFVDVDPATFNMDPERLEAALSTVPGIKAILPVHAFGGIADMKRINAIAARHGLPVVEDAACALGATLEGRQAGSWGVMGCFSFHPRKAVTTGEGGIITTNDDAIARTLRILRNHGLDPDAPTPDFVAPGYNLRLTEFQAAMGTTQLAKLERIVTGRRALAARYDALLAGTVIQAPRFEAGSAHVYQSYVVLLPAAAAPRRSAIIAALKERGIETTIGTYHMPMTTYFRQWGGFKEGDFPVTDDIAARAMTLPLHEGLTAEDQERVVRALQALVTEASVGA